MSDPKPSAEDVQQHFTARAATYQGAGDETLAAMVEFAALTSTAIALDVATGTGAVAFELAPAVGQQGRVVGVDLTLAMLQRAAERCRSSAAHAPERRVQLASADTTRLPFRDASFAVVACRFSVHHFTEAAAGLAEMARVLRPGGRLVIGEFCLPEDPDQAARFNHLERLRNPSHVEAFSESRLRALMADVGCPVRAVRHFTRQMTASAWASTANTSPEDEAEIRRLLRVSLDDDRTGLAPVREGDDIRLTRQDIVLWGQRDG